MSSILDFIFGGELTHYGVGKLDGAPGRGSGRYPLGSGKNPNQHTAGSFLDRIKELENTKDLVYIHPGPGKLEGKEFKGEQAVAKIMLGPDATTTMLRVQKSIASNEERSIKVAAARALRDQGLSLNEIAKEMGYENDSSVRSLLNDNSEARMKAAETTALYLKDIVDQKGMIDVGKGVERDIINPVSREKFEQALYLLQLQGYEVYGGGVKQATNPNQQTNLKVLCPPGTEHKDIYNLEIHSVKGYEDKILADNGNEIKENKLYPPASINSNRIYVRTAEEGGADKDGVIELRRGVKDLDLGDSHYAQVRIMVDGTHYLKGMAVYADDKDLPPGVDVIFNSKHGADTPKLDHFKKVKPDPENPFGALLRREDGQTFYDDPNGNYISKDGKKQSLNAVNKTRQEGDWDEWSDKLPSQFLAKQSLKLAKQQLGLAMQDKVDEYNEIISCTNPAVKKRLLQSFADDCDSSSVHLQAASLPRQKYKVILPLTTIKDDEVYAPGYQDGEKVALVRFPHEGTYQIPILTVNNKNKEGQIIFGKTPKDMVGLTKATANILSGADFDGDTVMVIPASGKNKIISRAGEHAFKDLKDFDTSIYGPAEIKKDSEGKEHYIRNGKEYKLMKNKQVEMGKISNLITDMTIRGAYDEELVRATKHSMVVIDAEKHHLDYKQSEKDNRIPELKRKYQGYIREDGTEKGGASTLISRAKGEYDVLKRQGQAHINQEGKPWYDPSRPPGALIFKTMDDDKLYYTDKKGKTKARTQKSTQMAETDDAYTLSSGRPMENAYAEYANFMKNLANTARTEIVNTKSIKYNPSSKIVYRNEVDSLDSKLNIAILNKPRERQAQIIAGGKIKAWEKGMRDDGVDDKTIAKEKKKYSQIQLEKARDLVGAKRTPIDITDKEWEAIQAGAISDNKLTQILNHCDIDKVKERAMPRPTKGISEAKQARIQRMKNNGYTLDEIAKAVGVSTSTVSKYL